MATKTILVLDPDFGIGALLATILEQEGYEVTVLQHLEEATRLSANPHFDLVITEAFDQRDPFDFDPAYLSKLRALFGDTPIVLFSTYVDVARVRAGQFGLADAVAKPLDIDVLLGKISKLLGKD